jgi:hypothetical protein
MMNYSKVGAPLAAAIDEIKNAAAPSLVVVIHTAEASDEAATIFLNSIGVMVYSICHQIFIATVSLPAVN